MNKLTGGRHLLARKFILRIITLCTMFFVLNSTAHAFDPFVVAGIRIEGTQRVTQGTVINYLSISPGDKLTTATTRSALRTLYETDFFTNVEFERDGKILVVKVEERPVIATFDIKGNKKLGGDELKESLKSSGLAEGSVFKRVVLDQVQQELRRQYYNNGRYAVRMQTDVEALDNNRVAININVDEGDVTEIRWINIVGNEVFDDHELLEQFQLTTPSLLTLFNSNDQYSQQKLLGDMEGLGAYYQNRGYIDFRIDSAQVAISPDKGDMYITISIHEGAKYELAENVLIGELIVGEAELQTLMVQNKGDTFSRAAATTSAKFVQDRLSDEGYAFAKVEPIPQADDESRQVRVTYNVTPGERVYVRHIVFNGNYKTDDETLRREMRLLEGDLFAPNLLNRSRARLSRLSFMENVAVDTKQVAGRNDQIDIEINVSERAPGSVQLGVGFSGSEGFLVNSSISHTNFRGTGQSISATVNKTETSELIRLSHREPWATETGIGRSVSAFFRRTDALATTLSSNFSTDALGVDLSYSFPLSDETSIRFGGGYRNTSLKASVNASDEVNQFLIQNLGDESGANFDTVTVTAGWAFDNRNRSFFPTRGTVSRINTEVAVPVGDLSFYTLGVNSTTHLPIWGDFVAEFEGRVQYADVYGDTTILPPYENFFAGGPESVRGYRSSSLGPKDSNDDSYGGSFQTLGRFELHLPSPLKNNNKSTRFTLFADAGNVFQSTDTWDANELRGSAGLAFYWLTPILGLMKFSYAVPINDQDGDRLDRFQFSFGLSF